MIRASQLSLPLERAQTISGVRHVTTVRTPSLIVEFFDFEASADAWANVTGGPVPVCLKFSWEEGYIPPTIGARNAQ
jgi:hypothetical protein